MRCRRCKKESEKLHTLQLSVIEISLCTFCYNSIIKLILKECKGYREVTEEECS